MKSVHPFLKNLIASVKVNLKVTSIILKEELRIAYVGGRNVKYRYKR